MRPTMYFAEVMIEGHWRSEIYTFGSGKEMVTFLKWVHKSASSKRKRRAQPIQRIVKIYEM